jgi:hypothetical protein
MLVLAAPQSMAVVMEESKMKGCSPNDDADKKFPKRLERWEIISYLNIFILTCQYE